jgi:hypothetical protein
MATPVTFNGVSYSIPAFGDVGYAQGPGNLSSYLIALATGSFQASGGLFSLTSQANFGPNFGLTAVNFTSTTVLPATAGSIRLAKTDAIDWRNNANTLNLPLAINASDQLTFNGTIVALATGAVSSVTGTANQINSTGGTTPVLSLSSTLVFPGTATGTLTGHSTLDLPLTGGTLSGSTTASGGLNLGTGSQISSNMSVVGLSLLNNQANTAGLVIQGFTGGVNGQMIVFTNNTANDQAHEVRFVFSGTGTQTILLPFYTDVIVGPRGSATFIFDGASGSWFMTGYTPGLGQIIGTTTNDNAAAGNVGEAIRSYVSGVTAAATGTFGNITSISLTPGDWDVVGMAQFSETPANYTGIVQIVISAFSGNTVTDHVRGDNLIDCAVPTTNISGWVQGTIAGWRVSVASTTTIFLKGLATFITTTPAINGRISARRVR